MRSAPPAVVLGRAPLGDPAEWMAEGAPEAGASGVDVDAAPRSAPPAPATAVIDGSAGALVRRRRREAIPVSAATTRSRYPDRLCAEAVDLARAAAEEAAAPESVGEHRGAGLRGGPGRHALLRVQGARLPRLALGRDGRPGLPRQDRHARRDGAAARRRRAARARVGAVERAAAPRRHGPRRPAAHRGGGPPSGARVHRRGRAAAELGGLRGCRRNWPRPRTRRTPELHAAPGGAATAARSPRSPRSSACGRARVLSRYGLHAAADRWDEAFGAKTPMAQAAPASCVSCGFLVPIAGSLRPGVRRLRERVLARRTGGSSRSSYGCGGHSEAAVMPKPPQPAPHVTGRDAGGRAICCARQGTAGRFRRSRSAVGGPRPLADAPGRRGIRVHGAGGRSRRPATGSTALSGEPLLSAGLPPWPQRHGGRLSHGARPGACPAIEDRTWRAGSAHRLFRSRYASGAHWRHGSHPHVPRRTRISRHRTERSQSVSMNATEGADPFGTARLRRGVLDAWAAAPARFREDANAEEDLALGGYRDRLVVELAQNAADAAARAGVARPAAAHPAPRDDGPAVLAAANTGAPLDAAGVESLSTLRASAKRDGPRARASAGSASASPPCSRSATSPPSSAAPAGCAGRSPRPATWPRRPPRQPRPRRRAAPPRRPRAAAPAAAARRGHRAGRLRHGRRPAAARRRRRGSRRAAAAAVDDALLLTLPGLAEVVVETPDGVRTLHRAPATARTTSPIEDTARGGATRWRTVAHARPARRRPCSPTAPSRSGCARTGR